MMSVKEYSEDVGLELKEILDLCKKLGIKVSNEDDMLDEDSIILLDNEIANGESSEEEVQEEVHEDLTEFEEDEVIEDKDEELAQSNKRNKPMIECFGICSENCSAFQNGKCILDAKKAETKYDFKLYKEDEINN